MLISFLPREEATRSSVPKAFAVAFGVTDGRGADQSRKDIYERAVGVQAHVK
jgi:hypothetical protein